MQGNRRTARGSQQLQGAELRGAVGDPAPRAKRHFWFHLSEAIVEPYKNSECLDSHSRARRSRCASMAGSNSPTFTHGFPGDRGPS